MPNLNLTCKPIPRKQYKPFFSGSSIFKALCIAVFRLFYTNCYDYKRDGSITYTADKIQGSYQPLILQNQFGNFADLTAFIDDNFSSGIRIGGVAIQGTSDSNSPITESGYYWWNIITFGVSNRITQIAVQTYIGYAYTNYMYVREKHDNQWSGWVKV